MLWEVGVPSSVFTVVPSTCPHIILQNPLTYSDEAERVYIYRDFVPEGDIWVAAAFRWQGLLMYSHQQVQWKLMSDCLHVE